MAEQFTFDDKGQFLERLEKLVREGVPKESIRVNTPFHVHEVDEILPLKRSKVKAFALLGAASGTLTGFAFTILTSLSWPLITGGKPIISIPPFIIIAFALTILFGGLSTFLGFLLLSRMPRVESIIQEEEYGNKFVITIEKREKT